MIVARDFSLHKLTFMSQTIQSLPGFRDFYPESCAVRNYIFETWRRMAHVYGFVEYEGPILEPTELYTRKSGDEIVNQLFNFEDKGERQVALRPEVTPTLARMAAARQRDYKKPMKWAQIGPCFRYETPQRGRGREFNQLNLDILGEAGIAADAELVAMSIDLMLAFGFGPGDFRIRLSDRRVWSEFASRQGMSADNVPAFLQVIDKLERDKPAVTDQKLADLGTSLEAVKAFMGDSTVGQTGVLGQVMENLSARGLAEYVHIDLGIVRGLAYYTGVVFEVFDARGEFRAVAGGGRYDNLCKLIGGVDLPAVGFAMGDMVIGEFINATAAAKVKLDAWLRRSMATDVFVVVADEAKTGAALGLVQQMRQAGIRTDYALSPAKVAKQFQSAENQRARVAVVVGAEFPLINVKKLSNRQETQVDAASAVATVQVLLSEADVGPLLA
jgi:histidyl-tRNA synthetase